jgi:hypothetical protein
VLFEIEISFIRACLSVAPLKLTQDSIQGYSCQILSVATGGSAEGVVIAGLSAGSQELIAINAAAKWNPDNF